MLVIDPPGITDFEGGYSAWQARKAVLASAATAAKNKAKSPPPPPPKKEQPKSQGSNSNNSKKDNPYARPFGRLTVTELEKQISDAEKSVADFQYKLADPALGRDPSRGKKLKADHDAMATKLEALEAEYYAREK